MKIKKSGRVYITSAFFAFLLIIEPVAAQSPSLFEIPLKSGILTLHKGNIDPAGYRYVIIQFEKPLSQEETTALRTHGVNLLSYLLNNAWVCAAESSAFTSSLISQFGIVAVTPWRAEYKLTPKLLVGEFEEWALTEKGEVKLLLTFFEDVSGSEMESITRRYSSISNIFIEPNVWAIQIEPSAIANLVNEDKVQLIAEGPSPPILLNDTSRAATKVESVQLVDTSMVPPIYKGLSGKSINIAICENADVHHPDFFDYSGNMKTPRFLNFSAFLLGTGSSHATHVAGTIGGNGWDSINSTVDGERGAAFQWRGMAPEALFINGGDLNLCKTGYESIYRVDVSNHSYVMNTSGNYDETAGAIDRAIRGGIGDKWKKSHIWGVGNNGLIQRSQLRNEGFYSIYGLAKNSIGVGAVNSDDRSLGSFSSLGPTFDGRIKPDVMAPGCKDQGRRCEGTSEQVGLVSTGQAPGSGPITSYFRSAGTSMATPVVTGTVALMLEEFVERHGINLDTHPPLPSTIKAILIQTAEDLIHNQVDSHDPINPDSKSPVLYYQGPDHATGYGLVNAQAAVNFIHEAASRTLLRESNVFIATEKRQVYELTVPASASELKVTLVWDDPEASPLLGDQRASRLVNNLDLVLKGPSGQWYFPWRLDPLPVANCDGAGPGCGDLDPIHPANVRPAYQGPDSRNNVEQVQINSPQEGTWLAYAIGYNIQVDGQSFSLVANVPLMRLAPAPADQPKRGDLNGDNLVDHSDNLIRYRHIANVPDYLLRDASFNADDNPEVNIADILQAEPTAYPFFIVNQFLRVSTSGFQTIRDAIGCPVNQNFVARFKFTARLINSRRSLHALVLRVQQLTNGNLLKNADAGPGGKGALMTVPKKDQYTEGILGPWNSPDVEFVDVPFEICLKDNISPFRFLVDVLGVARDEESKF